MKTVSVITTFYNAENFVLNAVSSVLQQLTTKDFNIEYVIVDDKSPDNSRKLIENYINNIEHKNINIRLIEPDKNLGCGGARKFGIENATGDYFMFLDADDYYMHIDFVKRAFEVITSEHADIVEYGMIFNQPNGSQQASVVQNKIIVTDLTQAELLLFKDNANWG